MYFRFCALYSLVPLPATEHRVCLYIAYLSTRLSYVSITNYLSALWYLHKINGYSHVEPSSFALRQTLLGTKRLLGAASKQSPPLNPFQLRCIYNRLDMNDDFDYCFWCAIIVCFRCLLRKAHVTVSGMHLTKGSFHFFPWGVLVFLDKTKTIQYGERTLRVPVCFSKGSIFCVASHMEGLFKRSAIAVSEMAFSYSKGGRLCRLTYSAFSAKLRNICDALGFPHFTSHSLRRGGATFLYSLGLSLVDIKGRGDWKSLAVLLYLTESLQDSVDKDFYVTKVLNSY